MDATIAGGKPSVSVIIPVYNEATHLRECLASLCSQDYPDYDVILVDNASTDETAKVCAEFPKVRYIHFDRLKSSYGARNEGASQSTGEVLAFFDGDQHALPEFLSRLLGEYVPGDPNHIYCIRLEDDARIPKLLRLAWSPSVSENDLSVKKRGLIGAGAVAVPRKLFEELGGFDETILSHGDHEFFGRAVQRAEVHYCDQVGAYHYWARSISEVLLREERFGFGVCLKSRLNGSPMPSLLRETSRMIGLTALKVGAAVVVPLRYPHGEWTDCWSLQLYGLLSSFYRLRGIWKYKLGFQRAGDLPPS